VRRPLSALPGTTIQDIRNLPRDYFLKNHILVRNLKPLK
jgi:hypothetical protein